MIRRAGLRHVRAPGPGSGYTPIWPPTKLPGCVAWLDMLETHSGDGTSVTNMVSSVAWEEGTNPPAYDDEAMNGLPCLAPDGADDRIISTESAALAPFVGSTHNPVTVVHVLSHVTPNRVGVVFSAANSAVAGDRFWQWGTTTAQSGKDFMSNRIDGGVTTSRRRIQLAASGVQTIAWRAIGGVISCFVNGAMVAMEESSIHEGSVTPNRLALFCRPDNAPDSFYDGLWGCSILYGQALTDAQVIGLQLGLMPRWKIPA